MLYLNYQTLYPLSYYYIENPTVTDLELRIKSISPCRLLKARVREGWYRGLNVEDDEKGQKQDTK